MTLKQNFQTGRKKVAFFLKMVYIIIVKRGVAQFGSALGSGANHRFPFCEFPKRREPLKTLTILVVTNLIKIPM